MIRTPLDVLQQYPVRKTRKQKQVFRDAVRSYAETMGYSCREEAGSFGLHNLIIGDPEAARYLVTAHYDTCARMIVPNFITPCNVWIYFAYQMLLILSIGLLSIGAGLLWTLLFIVPGIIAAYRYAMVPYLMAEFPDLRLMDAI